MLKKNTTIYKCPNGHVQVEAYVRIEAICKICTKKMKWIGPEVLNKRMNK